MGNNQEYEEFLATEENGSLNFKKVRDLFKRSALRILIFVIIALIISTSLLLLVIAFNTDKQYQTKVTFNNKYIEAGMSPWNSTMDISNSLRSSNVVSEAMKKSGFSDEEIVEHMDKILSNLTVVAISAPIPEKDDKVTTETYAYAYRINLPKISGLKWSREKYSMLLDNITDTFIANYKESFSFKMYNDSLAKFDSSKYNYMQSYDLLYSSILNMESIVNSMSTNAGEYRATSTGKSFNDFKAELVELKSMLNVFNSFLISTGVSSGNSGGKEIDFMKSRINTLSGQSKAKKDSLTSLEEAIKNIKQSVIVKENGTIVIDGVSAEVQKTIVDNYNRTLIELQNIDAELAKLGGEDGAKGDLAQYTTANTVFEGAGTSDEQRTALRAQTGSSIESIKSNIVKITADLNKNIEDYNKEGLGKNFIKKTAPASETTIKAVSTMIFLMVEIVVALAAMVAALIVTSKKGQLNFKKSQEIKEEVAE